MVGWHHQLDGHEFEQVLGVSNGQGSLERCSPLGHKELDTTQPLNNNNSNNWVFVAAQALLQWWCSGFSLRRLLGAWASVLAAQELKQLHITPLGLQSIGSEAMVHGMWDLPRPGIEPVCTALAGRFFTTEPPGKPLNMVFNDPNFPLALMGQEHSSKYSQGM